MIRKEAEAEEKAEAKTRRGEGDARIDELTVLVKRLVERVEKLQAELNEIRGEKKRPADKEEEGRNSSRSSDTVNWPNSRPASPRKKPLRKSGSKPSAGSRKQGPQNCSARPSNGS